MWQASFCFVHLVNSAPLNLQVAYHMLELAVPSFVFAYSASKLR